MRSLHRPSWLLLFILQLTGGLALASFSSASFANAICYVHHYINSITLSDANISREECKTLYLNWIANAMSSTTKTLVSSYDDDYFCPDFFDKFPCGSFWQRDYQITGGPFDGYWQGIPRNYTIKLTPPYWNGAPIAPESSTVLTSIEPSTQTYLAITSIDDNTGQASGGVTVNVTTDVLMYSGGHQHDNNRNTGQAGTLAWYSSSGKTINVGTGSAGKDHFTFTAPQASGDHTITVTCPNVAPSTCSIASGPNQIWVGVKDLQPLIPYGQYNLIGATTIHPDNHYLTSASVTKIMDLAYYYHSVSYPFDPVLQLNDSSLVRGGLFDCCETYTIDNVKHDRKIEGWWTPPHFEHRRGTVIDVQANGSDTAIPRANQKDFRKMMLDRQMDWREENLNKSGGHFHVRIQGVAE